MQKALENALKSIFLFVALAAFVTPMVLLAAWGVMLALGVINHDITAHVPALGYWATFTILWGGRMLLGVARSVSVK